MHTEHSVLQKIPQAIQSCSEEMEGHLKQYGLYPVQCLSLNISSSLSDAFVRKNALLSMP